ncbi:uncharacterized protein IWZ02DRAFT_435548 [Phyllosticta citriasiana]|uniref:uncharacterized protein n=1 Tax=Phyllosticta citriasiana TaxID=595635 RepID=UPI0030FD9599
MSNISGMATQVNLAALLKQDLTALTRMRELQGQFMKAWISVMGKAAQPNYYGTGADAIEKFLKNSKENKSVFPGLPSGVILKADLPSIREFLKEDAVCELLVHEPEAFLVTFPSGHTLAMVNNEADLASCKPSDDTIPESFTNIDQAVTNETEDVSPEPVEQTPISEPEPMDSSNIQSSASKDQPSGGADLTVEAGVANDESFAFDVEFHTGLTPAQEEFFFLCPELETSILESEVHAALEDIDQSLTPPHQGSDDMIHQTSTPLHDVTDSNDQIIIPSVESDESENFNGTAVEESAPAPTVTALDDLDSSPDSHASSVDGLEPAPYATPASSFTGSADNHGAACSMAASASTATPSDNMDSLSNSDGAVPSTPKLIPYATPVTHAELSSNINSLLKAAFSTPEPNRFATPSDDFDAGTEGNETVPATPTPAPRPSPMGNRNGGLPSYGDMAKEAFYNYRAPDRPADMIKFDQIYQYAEENYPAIKGKGESYKSGFRHAVPKAFVKIPNERKPDSSLWWTLDLVNFPGDNSARNRRKRRNADSVPPETPSKRPRKKSKAQDGVRLSDGQLVYGVQNVHQPVLGLQQGFFLPQQGGQQIHQQRDQQQFQPAQVHFLPQHSQQHSQLFHSQQAQQPAQQQLQSYQTHVNPQVQQYIDMKTHELAQQAVVQKCVQRIVEGHHASDIERGLWYQTARMGANQKILAGLGALP